MTDRTKIRNALKTVYDEQIIQKLYEHQFVIVERETILDTMQQLDKLSMYGWARDLNQRLKQSLIQPI